MLGLTPACPCRCLIPELLQKSLGGGGGRSLERQCSVSFKRPSSLKQPHKCRAGLKGTTNTIKLHAELERGFQLDDLNHVLGGEDMREMAPCRLLEDKWGISRVKGQELKEGKSTIKKNASWHSLLYSFLLLSCTNTHFSSLRDRGTLWI